MRSALGTILVIVGVAVVVVLALLVFQTIGLRDDLARAEDRVASLEAEVAAQQPGVTLGEVQRELDELRAWTRDWLIATDTGGTGGDTGTPAGGNGGGADYDDLVQRLDLVLDRIEALDTRVDEIRDRVPVC